MLSLFQLSVDFLQLLQMLWATMLKTRMLDALSVQVAKKNYGTCLTESTPFICPGMVFAFLKVVWCYWLLFSSQSMTLGVFLHNKDLLVILYLLSVDYSYKIRRNLHLLLLNWTLFSFVCNIILIITLFPVRLATFYSFVCPANEKAASLFRHPS